MGLFYAHGEGVARDLQTAVDSMRLASASRDPKVSADAHRKLEIIEYLIAEGIHPRFDAKALKQDAASGRAAAQYHIGLLRKYGLGAEFKPDSVQAASWYLKAARQGHARAQFHLADAIEHGRGVKGGLPGIIRLVSKGGGAGPCAFHLSLGRMLCGKAGGESGLERGHQTIHRGRQGWWAIDDP